MDGWFLGGVSIIKSIIKHRTAGALEALFFGVMLDAIAAGD